jgi:hypothetical protein
MRGGHQQQRSRKRRLGEDTAEDQDVEHTPAGYKLLESWAWGPMSASSVQDIAKAMVMTYGNSAPDVSAYARIGAHGHSSQNAQKCLLAQLGELTTPEPVKVRAPLVVRDGGGSKTTAWDEMSIFLPHDWFHCIFEHKLQECIFGVSEVPEFWASVIPSDPRLHKNPMKGENDWKNKFIAFQQHADGGPHQKHDCINVSSMLSLHTKMPVDVAALLLGAPPAACISTKKKCQEHDLPYLGDTEESLGVWWAWSWNAVWEGKHPAKDPYNNSWPRGSTRAANAGKWLDLVNHMRGTIWLLPADCKHLSGEYGLPNHACATPCMRCACNCTDVPWFDMSMGAEWRKVKYSPAHLKAYPLTSHWLMRVKGVSAFTFVYDPMHCLEIGPAGTAVATVFFDAVYHELDGTKAAKLKKLMEYICEAYKELGITKSKIIRLEFSYFCDVKSPQKNYPDLMSSAIKARQCRYLVPVAAKFCKDFFKPGDQYSRHRRECLDNLARFYDIVDGADLFLGSQACEAQLALHRFTTHYAALAKYCQDANIKKWPVRTKLHYAQHIAEDLQFINARAMWCYGGEHMVGSTTALAQSCLSGTAPHKVCDTVLAKNRVGKHLQFKSLL